MLENVKKLEDQTIKSKDSDLFCSSKAYIAFDNACSYSVKSPCVSPS